MFSSLQYMPEDDRVSMPSVGCGVSAGCLGVVDD